MSRSREDSHSPSAHGEEQDGAEAGSVAQMDFMFPKADHEVPREQEKEMEKCVVLVAADKWSHAVMASVAEQKGGASSVKLPKGLFDFCFRVSMQEVTIQCDNEPGIMAIAKNVEKMRLQNGLKTHIRRPSCAAMKASVARPRRAFAIFVSTSSGVSNPSTVESREASALASALPRRAASRAAVVTAFRLS